VESKIRDAQRDLFCKTLCQAYATLDDWHTKTMEEVRRLKGCAWSPGGRVWFAGLRGRRARLSLLLSLQLAAFVSAPV